VKFDHNKNNWSFSYSAMDFTDPGMNTFIYRLKGVNRNWVEAGNRREASYMNLSPGTYEFQVKGSNSSGLWSPEPATFSFVIKAPWWQSSLAYVFYFLLGLTAIYLVIQFRVRRANIKNQLTWEKREGERLKELDQVKARFFSTMTHEFKTPLSMIIEPIRQASEEVKDPGLKHHLNLAEQNSLHLLNLLQQIQQLSKLKSGRDQKESRVVNFNKLILKFSDNYHSVYERKGIQLKLELPEEDTHFLIDSPAVQQTLYYLFGNAIKNCPVNGEIIISQKISKLTVGDKRKINFRISYTKNQEGGGTTSKNEGLETVKEEKRNLTIPIGTIMIKEVIELIGGKIEVDRTTDRGAEIQVSFLLDEISGKAEAGSDTEKIESQVGWIAGSLNTMENQTENSLDDRELILLVEDNADLRLFIKSIVEPKYELIEAADGQEGLDKSIEVVPDLVITDWAMPKKDGLQMTRELKEHEITCHIPILILTAKTTKDERIEGLRAKADGFLTKPFHSEELLTTIETLISNRKTIIEKFLGGEKGEDVFPKDEMSEGNIYLLPDANFLNKIDEIILENITDEELGADTLAQKMYISRMQLYRKLKAISGQSAAVYIRNFRLKKARELLLGSRKNVNEVALMVGFSSRTYFSRRFKEKYGIVPSKAKKLL
jgi:DNA-binding response OmpR family regulator/signal transduction histidine kinase